MTQLFDLNARIQQLTWSLIFYEKYSTSLSTIVLVVLTTANFGGFSNFCRYYTWSQAGKSTGYRPTLKPLIMYFKDKSFFFFFFFFRVQLKIKGLFKSLLSSFINPIVNIPVDRLQVITFVSKENPVPCDNTWNICYGYSMGMLLFFFVY